MFDNFPPETLTDLADGGPVDAAMADWLADHPEAAQQIAAAQRVHMLLAELHAAEVVIPEGFEARLLEYIQRDAALFSLLDLGLAGFGQALIELLNALFSLLPAPQPAT